MQREKAKKAAKSAKATRPDKVAPPPTESLTWEAVAKFPLAMYHTLGRGLIIGFVEGMNDHLVRIHAPACIQELGPVNIAYVPMFGVEAFMDLRQDVVFATAPVPKLLAEGYLGYFAEFVKGSYKTKPVIVNAGIDTEKGPHVVSTETPPETPTETPEAPVEAAPEAPAEAAPSA